MFAKRNKTRRRKRSATRRRSRLESLEKRQLFAVLVTEPIQLEADSVSQFQPGAPGSYRFDTFLGAEFDTGVATIGGIIPVIETGLEAKLGLNGRIGFEVGANVSPGSVSAVSEFVVQQSYPDEIMLGPVSIDTSVQTSGGSFETTSPTLGGYADLIAEIGGTAQLEYRFLGLGDVIGGPFTAVDINQEIFALNRNDDRQIRLFGQTLSLNDLPPDARSIEIPLTRTPPTQLELSLSQPDNRFDALEGTATLTVGKGITVGKELGYVNISAPKIDLADFNDADGLSASGESDLATAKLELGTIVGSALGIGGVLGTTVIDLGIGTIEITTVRFDAGPELALAQDVEVIPTSRLTYQFDSEVEVHINGQLVTDQVDDPDKVTSVTFDPAVDKFKVYFRGDPIEVTPILETRLDLKNKIDLELQFGGRLTVGQLDASFFGLDPLTLGPLYTQDFSETVLAQNLFNDQFTIASETRALQTFTIGENFALPEDATIVTTTDDVTWSPENPLISLRQAIRNANFLDQQEFQNTGQDLANVIYLGAGTYRLTDALGGDLDIEDRDLRIVGTGQTIIDASGINDRLFDVGAGFGLTLEGVTIRGGNAVDVAQGENGGGIRNYGSVELVDVTVVGNRADNRGGGIYNAQGATLLVSQSNLSGNAAFRDGGAIANFGSASVAYSTLSENNASRGAAIANNAGQLTVNATTITENDAKDFGGGIYNVDGDVQLTNATVVLNTAVLGGGISARRGNFELRNSIVLGNSANKGTDDVDGLASDVVSLGYNLVGIVDDSSIFSFVADGGTDVAPAPVPGKGNPANLLPLGNYGGTTLTYLPIPGLSNAIGNGASTGVDDQRGFVFFDAPDIGATQYGDVLPVSASSDKPEFRTLTLRAAINLANLTGPDPKTIELSAGVYELVGGEGDELGDLDIRVPITIVGAGAQLTSIVGASDGNGSRVFEIHAGTEGVVISDLSIVGGRALGINGGGILNSGELTINRSIVADNYAEIYGGGIANSGTLTINDSAIDDNLATVGGGIWSEGVLQINSTTISNNNAEGVSGRHSLYQGGGGGGGGGLGGGIAIVDGMASLVQTTLSGNVAVGGIGGNVDDSPCPTQSDGLSVCVLAPGGFSGTGGGRTGQLGKAGDGGVTPGSGVFRVNGSNSPEGVSGLLGGGGGGGAIRTDGESNYVAGSGGGLRAGNGRIGNQLHGGGGGGGAGAGGGVFLLDGTLSIDSSTITENLARGGKGGVGVRGTEANPGLDATGTGGGIFVYQESDASIDLGNSIVSGNTSDPRGRSDIDGRATSRGNNLVGFVTDTSDFLIPPQGGSDIRDATPELGPLGDHGGIGMTHMPSADSPAIDRGVTSELTDGRGGQRNVGPGNDIGAIESDQLIVTSLGDTLGERSLRQALLDAEQLPGTNTIVLPGGTIALTAPLTLTSDVVLVGAGADQTTIDGSAVDGDLVTVDGTSLEIKGVSIVGPATGRILRIQNQATVGITESELIGGTQGVLEDAQNPDGGLIHVAGATLNIETSTLTGGIAAGTGGAISLAAGAVAAIRSSTIHGSTAFIGADAIHVAADAALSLDQSTVAIGPVNPNLASIVVLGQLELHNSIVEGGLFGEVSSLGNNLIGFAGFAVGLVDSDIQNGDPQLGELADNHGPTRTVLPAQTSAALDAGDNTTVTAQFDQRGVPRILGERVDIGAVERESLEVTRTTDDVEPGSLRRAILDGNQLTWAANIELGAGVYSLSLANPNPALRGVDDDNGLFGDLDISGNAILTGAGAGQTSIQTTSRFGARLFDVQAGASLGLSDLTLVSGAQATDVGGSIRNSGSLSVSRTEIRASQSNRGGALANLVGASATIDTSLFRDNESGSTGGAIDNQGTLDVRFSTFSGNSADTGSAISNSSSGTTRLTNVTIADNVASSTAAVENAAGGVVELFNSIVANNSGPNQDVTGEFKATYSLIGIGGDAIGFSRTDDNNIVGTSESPVDPLLGPLGDHGGPTDSYRPAPLSPAIDAGSDRFEDALLLDEQEVLTVNISGDDQRGVRRVQPNDSSPVNPIDIGSVESQFDLVQFVAPGSTVTIRESEPGFTEIEHANLSRRVINPYRSLSIRTTDSVETSEYFIIESGSSDYVVDLATSDTDVTELLAGAKLNLSADYQLRGELRSVLGDGQIVVTAGGVTLSNPTLTLSAPDDNLETFTLLDNQTTAAVNGQFAGLPEGTSLDLGGREFTISYKAGDGNDVVLAETVDQAIDLLYFSAVTEDRQRELFLSDGTELGTYLLNDLNGLTSSNPKNLTIVGDTLFFTARDENGEAELYKTDGTTAGTTLVRNISNAQSSDPQDLTAVGERLFFTATGNDGQVELYTSDGSEQGTVLVTDLAQNRSSDPQHLTAVSDTLFFSARNSNGQFELHKSDGTAAGTVIVKDFGSRAANPRRLTAFNGQLYFVARGTDRQTELYRSDGTEQGTVRVKNLAGPLSSVPRELTVAGDSLYFIARAEDRSFNLYKSDGTDTGTTLVRDLSDLVHSTPRNLTAVRDDIYFVAMDANNRSSLFRSDGTADGTEFVKDFSDSLRTRPRYLTAVGDTLYFSAHSEQGQFELHKTDGTSEGTVVVKDLGDRDASPRELTEFRGDLYFVARGADNRFELYRTDGTDAGTNLVKDLAGSRSGIPRDLTVGRLGDDVLSQLETLHNEEQAADVNNDGRVTALDALLVINYLSHQAASAEEGDTVDPNRLMDTNEDGRISAVDALFVINEISRTRVSAFESERQDPVSSLDLDEQERESLSAEQVDTMFSLF